MPFRPGKGSRGETRDARIFIRLHDGERERLEKIARQRGLDLGTWDG
jgi:hypothetical protein